MSRSSHNTGSSVVTSLQASLAKDNLEELHQYITEGTHLDLSTAWSTAVQANESNSSTAIVKAISQILIKIDGENGFISPGSAFIRRTLSEHTRSILRNLSSLRPLYVNPTLRMLITMAQFDAGALSNDVYLSLDFATFKVLPKLLTRSGPQTQKPKDEKVSLGKRKRDDNASKDATRGLFIGLLFTLLNRASSTTKTEIIQRAPIMQELIKFLSSDSEESVIKTLKGFIVIMSSREIPRPAKVQCFNESTLAQLRLLYSYESTTQAQADNEDSTLQNGGPEGSNQVRKLIHDFFVAATTLPDHGLCFASKGLVPPANKKLYNPILGSFVLTLDAEDELQADLLVDILKVTPELIPHWSQNTKIDFTPRLDASWVKFMQIFENISNEGLPSDTLAHLDQIPDFVFVEYVLPSPLAKIASKGLQHESVIVKLMTCRTLVKCLNLLRGLDKDDDKLDDLVEQIQKKAPLIETILPLATIEVKQATEESHALLRQEAIILLELYVSSFSSIPSFDFVKLFETILGASIGKSGSVDEEEHSYSTHIIWSHEENRIAKADLCLSSIEEQRAVLRMANHIPGLPWLTKRGTSRSMVCIVLRFMFLAQQNEMEAAADMLWKVITADSIALYDQGLTAFNPVCKLIAFVAALDSIDDELNQGSRKDDVLEFVEHCMIKFQAAPYKYWDTLTELCATHNLDLDCDFSLILLTFKEQLPFFPGKDYIGRWYERVLEHLVSIGEDQAIADIVLGQSISHVPCTQNGSLWNGVRLAFVLFRNAPEGQRLYPDELEELGQTYLDDSDIEQGLEGADDSDIEETLEREHGDILPSSEWRKLMHVLDHMAIEDKREYQRFLLALWTSQSDITDIEATNMLVILTRKFDKVDQDSKCMMYDLLERVLPLADGPAVEPYPILDSSEIRTIAERIADRSNKLSMVVKAGLLEGIIFDEPESHVQANTALFSKMITPADLYHQSIQRAVTQALASKALERIPLNQYICTGDVELERRSLHDISEEYLTKPEDIANCIATYLSNYPSSEIPAAFLHWTKSAPFVIAAIVISELLKSKSQEIRECGHQVLEAQNNVRDLLESFDTPSDAVLQCIRAKVKDSPAVQNDWIKTALIGSNTKKRSTTDSSALLVALGAGACSLPDDIAKILSTHHVSMVDYFTRQFAEHRIEENKTLNVRILDNVLQFAHYIAHSPRFVGDVGRPMLDTMVSAAIENQLEHLEVIRLLINIVQSTTSEAFNYAKTIQALLADKPKIASDHQQLATLELLHALILHDPQKANLGILDELLKSYHGTLSRTDMLRYDIICELESTLNVSVGSRIQSWRVLGSIKDHVIDHRKVDAVLAGDRAKDTMFGSLEHDTLQAARDLELTKLYDDRNVDDDFETLDETSGPGPAKIYDLRFMLPLIAGFVHADPSISMLKQLLQNHAAGLAFLGLASHHLSIRQQASQILARFDTMLQSSTIREKAQLSTIFQIVKNSITTTMLETSPIPLIHAVFLGLATHIMMEPAHFLYEKMNRFILARPQIDFDDIPMFLTLFNAHESYSRHVVWVISLLRAGLRGSRDNDARGYGRRHVLEMCMGLYGSKTANPAMKEGIKDLFTVVIDDGEMRRYFERVGGPTWIKMVGDFQLRPDPDRRIERRLARDGAIF